MVTEVSGKEKAVWAQTALHPFHAHQMPNRNTSARPGVPNPPAEDRHRPRGLLGTGPHGRRWAAGEHVKFHLPSPITTTTTPLPPLLASPPETRPRAHPWKNCLPQSWSPVPKRLGTPELDHSHHPMRNFNKLSKLWFAKIRYKFKFYMSIKAQIINREN